MKLDSSNPPVYLPQKEQQSVLRLGFENCAAEQWLFPAIDLAVFHQHKTALSRSTKECFFAQTPESSKAQGEFHDFLLDHLLQHSTLGYRKIGERLVHEREGLSWNLAERTLWLASLWIAEDICLLQESPKGYIMTAASVCAPSNWLLENKIGRSVDSIHEPVPDYDKVLSDRVNRFLHGLRSGRVMLRYNWSIQWGNELFWRDHKSVILDPTDNGEQRYWRVERQTFIRLPNSGAIVFGIRIFLHSFESLQGQEEFNSSIEQLLSQLPKAQKQYKGLA
ncbi:MAG: DUF3445 domain-containing protein [Pseudohongiellaceae bacterium]